MNGNLQYSVEMKGVLWYNYRGDVMYNMKLIRSARRSLAIEITPDGNVIVRAPFWVTKSEIFDFVSKKEKWIYKKISEIKSRPQETLPEKDELETMRERVRLKIKERLQYWEKITGLSPKGVKITSAR